MPHETSNLRRWLSKIGHFTGLMEDFLLVLILSIMIIIAVSQILLRNYFDIGLVWSDSLLRALVLWVGLLGAIVASRNENHISIDILSRFMSARIKAISNIVTDIFTVVVCVVVSYYSYNFVKLDFDENISTFGDLPAWMIESILPIGFAVIALRYAEGIVRRLLELRGQPQQ